MPDLNNLPDTCLFLTSKNIIMREQQTNSLYPNNCKTTNSSRD
jgi:hypothetical protein